eukprot:g2418.t1
MSEIIECKLRGFVKKENLVDFLALVEGTLGDKGERLDISGWTYLYDDQCPLYTRGEEFSKVRLFRSGLSSKKRSKDNFDDALSSDCTLKYVGNLVKNPFNVEVRKDIVLNAGGNAGAFLLQLGFRRDETRFHRQAKRFVADNKTEIHVFDTEKDGVLIELIGKTDEAGISEMCKNLQTMAALYEPLLKY